MLLLLDLFWTYVKIGFTSFGGMSMVPLINSEMLAHGWMTETEVGDIVAIAEMTPGPLGLNCASFVGMRVAGVPGVLFATLGVITPTLTLTLLAAIFLKKFQESRALGDIMYGVRPAALGMIFATIVTLFLENYIVAAAPYWPAIVIGLAAAALLIKFKFSIPLTIAISAALGLLLVR